MTPHDAARPVVKGHVTPFGALVVGAMMAGAALAAWVTLRLVPDAWGGWGVAAALWATVVGMNAGWPVIWAGDWWERRTGRRLAQVESERQEENT